MKTQRVFTHSQNRRPSADSITAAAAWSALHTTEYEDLEALLYP